MEGLKRCAFCNQVLKESELKIIDKDVGRLCEKCYLWLENDFLEIYRRNHKCQ